MESPTDYRRLAQHQRGLYFVDRDDPPRADAELGQRFLELANHQPVGPRRVAVAMQRTLNVPKAAGCIAKFGFVDLCGQPLGAADYIALANAHHTVAVQGVPRFGPAKRAEAYRFVTLIDVMYEHRVRMLFSAEVRALPKFTLFCRCVCACKRARVSEKGGGRGGCCWFTGCPKGL